MENKTTRSLSIIALVISGAAALIAGISCYTGISSVASQLRRQEKEEWESVVVYDIVYEATNSRSSTGITFEQIRQQYITEAKGINNPLLETDDLQPLQLKKVLLALEKSNQVYLEDGKYHYNNAGTNTLALDAGIINKLYYSITLLATDNPGKSNPSECYTELAKTINDIRPDVFYYTLNNLLAIHQISVDANGKIWSAANCACMPTGPTKATPTTTTTPTESKDEK